MIRKIDEELSRMSTACVQNEKVAWSIVKMRRTGEASECDGSIGTEP